MEASAGSLDIVVNEKEEFAFSYTKVADYENGEFVLKEEFQESNLNLNEITKGNDMRKAAEILGNYESEKEIVQTKNQVVQVGPLSEGVYLIEGVFEEGYEIPSTLVSIPQWNEGEEELSYQVTVMPKIQRTVLPVETGDSTNLTSLIILCAVSLAVVGGITGRAYFLKDR